MIVMGDLEVEVELHQQPMHVEGMVVGVDILAVLVDILLKIRVLVAVVTTLVIQMHLINHGVQLPVMVTVQADQ